MANLFIGCTPIVPSHSVKLSIIDCGANYVLIARKGSGVVLHRSDPFVWPFEADELGGLNQFALHFTRGDVTRKNFCNVELRRVSQFFHVVVSIK